MNGSIECALRMSIFLSPRGEKKQPARSLGLDLHLGGDLAPGVDLLREPGLGIGERGVRHRVKALLLERRACLRRLQSSNGGVENRLQNFLRRAGRREQALPGNGADAGETD